MDDSAALPPPSAAPPSPGAAPPTDAPPGALPPAPPSRPSRAARWRHRAVYLGVVLGFFLLLAWSGSGRTTNLHALQRQLSIELQATVVGLEYRNVAEGVLLVSGRGVFRFLDVLPAWERYRDDATTTLADLADVLAAPLCDDLAAIDAWLARDDAAREADLVVLPVPLLHFGSEMTSTLAARHLVVASAGDLPAYLFLLDRGDRTLRPLTRDLAATAWPAATPAELVRRALVAQDAVLAAERATRGGAASGGAAAVGEAAREEEAGDAVATSDREGGADASSAIWVAGALLPPVATPSGGVLPPLARLIEGATVAAAADAASPAAARSGLPPCWATFDAVVATSPWNVRVATHSAAELLRDPSPDPPLASVVAPDGTPRWPRAVIFELTDRGWRAAGFR